MNLIQAIYARHAVRHYDGKPISIDHKKALQSLIDQLNAKSGLHIQLVINEPKAFGGEKAKVCNFTGCVNYLAMVGPSNKKAKEMAGYYGEKLVLFCQQMGINSCWVVLTFDNIPSAYSIKTGEELYCVIALGYGTTQGKPHNSKTLEQVIKNKGKLPEWFISGAKSALLAPTGRNQQGFTLELLANGNVKITNDSLCKELDLGIIKYHFEIGSHFI